MSKATYDRENKHCNPYHIENNVLCVIEIKTSGPKPYFHDIVDLAILPVDGRFQPSKVFKPFHVISYPKRPKNIVVGAGNNISRENLVRVLETGMMPDIATTLFHSWFTEMKLAKNGKLIPVAFNWSATLPFLEDWLGWSCDTQKPVMYDYYFCEGVYRDVIAINGYLQDMAWFNSVNLPFHFNETRKSLIMKIMEVEPSYAEGTYAACIDTANIFKAYQALHLPTGISFIK